MPSKLFCKMFPPLPPIQWLPGITFDLPEGPPSEPGKPPERLFFFPYNIIKAHLLGLLGLLAFVGFYGTKTPERIFQIKSGARDEGF